MTSEISVGSVGSIGTDDDMTISEESPIAAPPLIDSFELKILTETLQDHVDEVRLEDTPVNKALPIRQISSLASEPQYGHPCK